MARGARLPGEAWTPRDWALAQAVEMLDRSRCSGCGEPRWLSHDKTSMYKPHKVKCEGCESISILKSKQPDDLEHAEAYHFYTEHVGHDDKKRGRRGNLG